MLYRTHEEAVEKLKEVWTLQFSSSTPLENNLSSHPSVGTSAVGDYGSPCSTPLTSYAHCYATCSPKLICDGTPDRSARTPYLGGHVQPDLCRMAAPL
ncbi:hypothetical protein ACLOJK_018196, partial [Asimina triloba]